MLFRHPDGRPIRFRMIPGTHREEIKPLIEKHGGIMTSRGEKDYSLAIPGKKLHEEGFLKIQYIHDCIDQGILLDPAKYRAEMEPMSEVSDIDDGQTNTIRADSKALQGRKEYYKHEDESIVKYLYDNDLIDGYKGNAVWKKMALHKVTNHSWQSMKYRFSKHILKHISNYDLPSKVKKKLKKDCNQDKKNLNESLSSEYPESNNEVASNTATNISSASTEYLTAASDIAEDIAELETSSAEEVGQSESILTPRKVRRRISSLTDDEAVSSPRRTRQAGGSIALASPRKTRQTGSDNEAATSPRKRRQAAPDNKVVTSPKQAGSDKEPTAPRKTKQAGSDKEPTAPRKTRQAGSDTVATSPRKTKEAASTENETEILLNKRKSTDSNHKASPAKKTKTKFQELDFLSDHGRRSPRKAGRKEKNESPVLSTSRQSNRKRRQDSSPDSTHNDKSNSNSPTSFKRSSTEKATIPQNTVSPTKVSRLQTSRKSIASMINAVESPVSAEMEPDKAVSSTTSATSKEDLQYNRAVMRFLDSQMTQTQLVADESDENEDNNNNVDQSKIQSIADVIHTVCDWLDLEAAEFMHVLYGCNGSVRHAVSYILTGKPEMFTAEDDHALLDGDADRHQQLKNKFGTESTGQRLIFLSGYLNEFGLH